MPSDDELLATLADELAIEAELRSSTVAYLIDLVKCIRLVKRRLDKPALERLMNDQWKYGQVPKHLVLAQSHLMKVVALIERK